MLHTNMFVKQLYLLHYISELPYQYILNQERIILPDSVAQIFMRVIVGIFTSSRVPLCPLPINIPQT